MKITVCTGWSPAGYLEYGKRFAESFDRFWPKAVDLVVYGEEPVDLPRGEFRLLADIEGCAEFLARHDNAVARGVEPNDQTRAKWKPKHFANRYNFRFDAWKFCRQGFIPWHTFLGLSYLDDPQLLVWLDGDVVTHAPVPPAFIEGLLPARKEIAYLGRGEKHSEIGFQLYRIDGDTGEDRVARMLELFRDIYANDEVFALREWHSAYVFDEARRRTQVAAHDLTPGGHGHVWHQSPLRMYTDHLKGKRKDKGRSDERRN